MTDKERGAYLSSLETLTDSNDYKLALGLMRDFLLKEEMNDSDRIEYLRLEAMVQEYEYMESLEEEEEDPDEAGYEDSELVTLDRPDGSPLDFLKPITSFEEYKKVLNWYEYFMEVVNDCEYRVELEEARELVDQFEELIHSYHSKDDSEDKFEPLEREEYILYKPEGNIEGIVKPITNQDERHLVNKWRSYYLFVRQNCDPFSEDREEADKYLRILEDLDDEWNGIFRNR
jgi:hypothetical protein